MPENTLRIWRALWAAARRAARRKRRKGAVAAFELRALDHVNDLAVTLADGTWQPKPGFVFVTSKPKHREIHAARFEDRVVHHLIMAHLAPELERRFSPASYACRVGMGTHAAAEALRSWLWRLSRRGQQRGWVLRMDVKNFFHTIHLPTLADVLRRPIACVMAAHSRPPFDLNAAVQAILSDRPGLRAVRVGRLREFAHVPEHKRLAAQANDRGLPIGNLTSQWFANAYLDGLDHFVRRTLGFRGYVRYMDDFVVCDTDPQRLEAARQRITAWLGVQRKLAVHCDWPLVVASDGVDFIGHIVRPSYALVRRRVVIAAHDRLWRRQAALRPRRLEAGQTVRLPGGLVVDGPAAIFPLAAGPLRALRDGWAAFTAATRQAAGWALRQRMRRLHPFVAFHLDDRRGAMRLRYAWGAGRPTGQPDLSLRRQIDRLLARRRDVVGLVQVGSHAELLRPFDWRRLRVPPHRLGRARFGAGTPAARAGALVARSLARGTPVLWIAETGGRAGPLAERMPTALVTPLGRTIGYWRQRAGTDWPAHGRPAWPLRHCRALRRGGGCARQHARSLTCAVPRAGPPDGAGHQPGQPMALSSGQYLLPFAASTVTIALAPRSPDKP